MKMRRPEKETLVSSVVEKLKASQSVVMSDFQQMTVAELTDLRNQLRAQSIEVRVIKNRLIKLALEEAGFEKADDFLVGNTAVAFGIEDPGAPAKILLEYAKKNNKLVVKGGLVEGKRLDAQGVVTLSKMPGRKELLSILAGDLKQPATKVAMVMQAALLKVAHAMNALAQKQETAA